jgi:hypothetical protein
LNLLGQEIHSRRTLIAALNDEMRLIEQEQQSMGQEIRALETALQQKKQKYAQALRSMYNARLGVDEMLFVLTSQNFTQIVRRARYLKEYSDWRKAQAREIIKEQEVLQGKKESWSANGQNVILLCSNVRKRLSICKRKKPIRRIWSIN